MNIKNNNQESGAKKPDLNQLFLKYGKYIGIAVVALIAIALIITFGNNNNKKDPKVGTQEAGSSMENSTASEESEPSAVNINPEQESSTETETEVNELKKDAYPEINQLVNDYFTAKKNCDVDELARICTAVTDDISLEKLQKEREYIEDYVNIATYTKKGLLEKTYVVYVAFEFKFVNIETTVPTLIRMYVCTNEEGNVYINNGSLEGEVATYLNELAGHDDVVQLINETNTKLNDAIASNEALKGLYQRLEEGASSDNQSSAESTEQPSSQEQPSESETQPPATEPETTTQAQETFTSVNEIVYATQNVKIRKSPSVDAEVIGSLPGGDTIERTGYSDNWSRVNYNGQEGYIAAGYLVVTKYTEVDEYVYAKEDVRVRASDSADAEVVGTLRKGERVKRTGYSNDWSRVIYDGQVCYIGKGYLTTSQP